MTKSNNRRLRGQSCAMHVSVIIPVFNAERFVEEAIASALVPAETAELILVEDGSTDRSLAICERAAQSDERVRLLRHPNGENRGAAEARNLGVQQARFDYASFLDADDYYLPQRFEEAWRLLANNRDIDGVYGGVGTVYETPQMKQWWRERRNPEISMVPEAVDPEHLFETLVQRGAFHTNGLVVRRTLFERTGLFDPHLRLSQDYALWIKMSAVGRLVGGSLTEPVAMRRLHGANRIVRNEIEHRLYGYQMWVVLADWAEQSGLPEQRRQLLVRMVMESWVRLKTDQQMKAVGHASAIRFLAGLAARHPSLMRARRFWNLLGRACRGAEMSPSVRSA